MTGAFSAQGFEVMRDLQLAVRGTADGAAGAAALRLLVLPDGAAQVELRDEPERDRLRPRAACRSSSSRCRSPASWPRSRSSAASCSTRRRRSPASCSRQLAAPGAPVVWGGSPAVFDIRHETTPMGAIETMMLDCANAEVGKRLCLPTQGYIALSDAKALDAQAGLETGIGAVLAGLSGINSVSGPGMLDFESCQSLEKLVVDDEICGMVVAPAPGHRAARRLPVAPALRGAAAGRAPADRRPHAEAPQGADAAVARRSSSARRSAAGARTARRRSASGRRREVERLLAAWTPSRLPDETKRALRERMAPRRGGRGHGRPADGGELREIVRFTKTEAQPTLDEVLGAQGLPAEDALAPRLRRLLDEALADVRRARRAAGGVRGADGRGVRRGPRARSARSRRTTLVVGRIYPRAQALALFVATLGEALPARIRRLFDEDALAEGYMLDAVASAGADLLSDRLAERFEARLGGARARRDGCCPTAPATAAGPPRGQKPLFAALQPGRDRRDAQRLVPDVADQVGLGRPRGRSRRGAPLPARLPVLPRVPDPRVRPAHGLGPEETERETTMDILDRIADALQQGDDAQVGAARRRGPRCRASRPARSFRRASSPG